MSSLVVRVSRRQVRQGTILFGEGDPCAGLFLVASGKIRIFKLSPTGREQVLSVEGPGSSFAELPVFDGGNYPASASALEDAEVLFISRKDFQNFCREHPDVALKVICRSRLTFAASGRDHRRFVVHHGTAAADLPHPAIGTGNRNSREGRRARGADENASRPGGGIGYRPGTRVAESRPASSRRLSGSGRPQNHRERPRRIKTRTNPLRVAPLRLDSLRPACDLSHCLRAARHSLWASSRR